MKIDRDLNKLRMILEYLSVEELEELLQQDFEASDWVPDTEYIRVITEELEKREHPQKENTRKSEGIDEESEKEVEQLVAPMANKIREKRLDQTSVKVTVVVSIILIAIGFLNMYLQNQSNDPFSELRELVGEKTDNVVVPQWVPDQYHCNDGVSIAERSDGSRFACAFDGTSGNHFTFRVVVYTGALDPKGQYQKDDSPVIIYEAAGINHYIMSNNKTNTAAWINEETENMITGDLTVDELKRMIDSIYEE